MPVRGSEPGARGGEVAARWERSERDFIGGGARRRSGGADTIMGYTASAKSSELKETWYIVDARNQVLGKIASAVASALRGKHLTNYTPHADMKTHVIVVNAEKVHLTGRKWDQKEYHNHSGWPGGLRTFKARQLNQRKPGELVRRAVWGMLPKNRLGRGMLTRLRVVAGPEHRHQAQKPTPLPTMERKSSGAAAA
jgi:large subunit ribosomal protein L13